MCIYFPKDKQRVKENPCQPSPCGPNSECSIMRNTAVCSCLSNFYGTPPSCRPECTSDSDCPLSLSCYNQRCVNPCTRGTCGYRAECEVIQHKPSCSCPTGYLGNPYTECTPYETKIEISREPEKICNPSPCGPFSKCSNTNNAAVCSCLPNYVGTPPYCKPECTSNSECSSHLSCINMKCQDPCEAESPCGISSKCKVLNHITICYCDIEFTGDPLIQCTKPILTSISVHNKLSNPCIPSPCGRNAVCQNINNIGICSCLTKYYGNPYYGCRPECVVNSDCPSDKFCMNNECKPTCAGICGVNAICNELNHLPVCHCRNDYTGNPFEYCSPIQSKIFF